MAMLGRKPFDPNAAFPAPASIASDPLPTGPALSNVQVPPLKAPASHNWIGILADALSGLAGQPGPYAAREFQRQQEQSAFDRGETQWQNHRSQDLADQFKLLDYKRLHPDDALSQALDQAGITDPAERQKYYRANADRLTAPPMMSAQGVDEQGNPVMRFFPRAQPAPPPAMPAPTVGTVRNGYRFKGGNPASQSAWEPAGGPTPQASGTFP